MGDQKASPSCVIVVGAADAVEKCVYHRLSRNQRQRDHHFHLPRHSSVSAFAVGAVADAQSKLLSLERSRAPKNAVDVLESGGSLWSLRAGD